MINRLFLWGLRFFLVLLGIPLIIALCLMVRLSIGPIDITFLKNYYEPAEAIQRSSFDVNHIFLEYKGVQEPFVLDIDHLTLFDEDHEPFVQIPELILSLDYSALLKGKIRLKTVHLHGPQLIINMKNSAVELEESLNNEEYFSYSILAAFMGVGPAETQKEIRKILKYLDEIYLEAGSLKIFKENVEILSVSQFNVHLNPSDQPEASYFFKVEAQGFSFFSSKLDKRVFEIPEMVVQGEVCPGLQKTEFVVAPFEWQGAIANLTGSFSVLETSLAVLKLTLTSTPIPLTNFPNVWPEGLATTTRDWIIRNLSKGGIDNIQLNLELAIPFENKDETSSVKLKNLTGRFDLKDVMVDYITGLPHAEVISGIARFNMDQFDIEIVKASLQDINVVKGYLHFFDLSTDIEKAKIDLTLEGPLINALEVIDYAPLKYAQKLGIRPEDFKGDALVQLVLTFPLLVKLELDEIDILTMAKLKNISYTHGFGGENQKNVKIREGDFDLVVDKSHMKMQGNALVEGSKSVLSWTENFNEDSPFSREMTCRGFFSTKTFENFGMPIEKFVKGMVNLDVLMHEKNKNYVTMVVKGNLKDADLNFPMLSVHKRVGEEAITSCVLEIPQNKPWTISKILLKSPSIHLSGAVVLDQKSQDVKSMDLSVLKPPKTHMSIRLSKIDSKTYDLKVWGKSLDATWFFKNKHHQTKDEETNPDFKLELSLDRLWTHEQEFLKSVNLLLNRKNDRYTKIECDGILKDGEKLLITFKSRLPNPGALFFLKANNAGDFFRLINFYDDLKGGVLTIEGARLSDDPKAFLEGHATLVEFRLMKAPILAKILSLASVGGIADFLGDKGLYFDEGTLTFKATDDVIEIQKGLAESSATGITVTGFVDRVHKTLKLNGNVIPVYILNSLIGKIPILGNILSGGEDKGFLAATYEVTGGYDDPKVSVNPLSMLTPGFLRELF